MPDHKILILNGPNLNMLGRREPEIYGSETLGDVEKRCAAAASKAGVGLDFKQSNDEGELVGWIQSALDDGTSGVIINAAAYTHTSVAIHDALKLLTVPIIELHISEPKDREEFRHHSYVEAVAQCHISGKGTDGYVQAIDKLLELL